MRAFLSSTWLQSSKKERQGPFVWSKIFNGNKTEIAINLARRVEAFVPRGPLAFSVVSVLHITSVQTKRHTLQYHAGHLFLGSSSIYFYNNLEVRASRADRS